MTSVGKWRLWWQGQQWLKTDSWIFTGRFVIINALILFHLVLKMIWLLQTHLQTRAEFTEMSAFPTQQSPCSASFSRNNTLAWINSLSLSHLPRNHSWGVRGQTWPVSAQSQRIIFWRTKGMTLNHFLSTQEDSKPTPGHPTKNLKSHAPPTLQTYCTVTRRPGACCDGSSTINVCPNINITTTTATPTQWHFSRIKWTGDWRRAWLGKWLLWKHEGLN